MDYVFYKMASESGRFKFEKFYPERTIARLLARPHFSAQDFIYGIEADYGLLFECSYSLLTKGAPARLYVFSEPSAARENRDIALQAFFESFDRTPDQETALDAAAFWHNPDFRDWLVKTHPEASQSFLAMGPSEQDYFMQEYAGYLFTIIGIGGPVQND